MSATDSRKIFVNLAVFMPIAVAVYQGLLYGKYANEANVDSNIVVGGSPVIATPKWPGAVSTTELLLVCLSTSYYLKCVVMLIISTLDIRQENRIKLLCIGGGSILAPAGPIFLICLFQNFLGPLNLILILSIFLMFGLFSILFLIAELKTASNESSLFFFVFDRLVACFLGWALLGYWIFATATL